ncbi:MAG: hypothetical protein AB8B56_12155 [Crocinitomicaceae bacterium]
MNNRIPQIFFQLCSQITCTVIILLCISSCSVSNRSFNKRKYTPGHFSHKRKIPKPADSPRTKNITEQKEVFNTRVIQNVETNSISTIISKSDQSEQLKPQHGLISRKENKSIERDNLTLAESKGTSFTKEYATQNESICSTTTSLQEIKKREYRRNYGYTWKKIGRIFLISLGIAMILGYLLPNIAVSGALYYILVGLTVVAAGCALIAAICLVCIPIIALIDAVF